MGLKFLIGAPVAIFSLYVLIMTMDALQDTLGGALTNSRNSSAIIAMVGIIAVIFAVGVVWNIYKTARGNEYYYEGMVE